MKNIVASFILIFAVNFNYSQESDNNEFWRSFPIEKEFYPDGFTLLKDKKPLKERLINPILLK